jgi:Zinc dependent phospholipase C
MVRLYKHSLMRVLIVVFLFAYNTLPCNAFSVLTHEAIVDANWDQVLLPLLKQKYPRASAEELKEAHAYVYGGALAPDMGYYPLSCKLFTDLIHYVRSGDFIESLFSNAQNLNDYAFAAGVLCHYYADVYGHSEGINVSVPLLFRAMRKRYGDTVTYAENHLSHIRTEFSFDVLQTARGNYASTAYHDFIGFQIPKPLLKKAFLQTYGLDIDELFGNFEKATARFRWGVVNLLPFVTKAAWATKRSDIRKLQPTATGRNFIYRMHRRNYRHQFGQKEEPKFFEFVFSIATRILPRIGPFRILKFKAPPPEADKHFVESFDSASQHYARFVVTLNKNNVELENLDFDTGKKTAQGEYALADQTYCKLLMKLKEKGFETVSSSLKDNILSFYGNQKIMPTKTNAAQAEMNALAELRMRQPTR